jgi:glycosyltransferase involved in cell wall biosynthesis
MSSRAETAPQVSAVLAVRDEAAMIRNCLDLLGFADEIVVVIDARTTDETATIAREYTSHVHVRAFDDFSQQKNYALAQANGDWILAVDADERVTPALAEDIVRAVRAPGRFSAFRVPRENFQLGRPFRHTGWGDDRPIRLVRQGAGSYEGQIHETLSVRGEVGDLTARLWHFTHRDVESMLRKTVVFGEVQARELAALGHPPVTAAKLARVVVGELYRRLVRGRAWRDGTEGVIESFYQPFSLFCVHVMLWQRQLRPSLEERYRELEDQARRT